MTSSKVPGREAAIIRAAVMAVPRIPTLAPLRVITAAITACRVARALWAATSVIADLLHAVPKASPGRVVTAVAVPIQAIRPVTVRRAATAATVPVVHRPIAAVTAPPEAAIILPAVMVVTVRRAATACKVVTARRAATSVRVAVTAIPATYPVCAAARVPA